MGKNMARRFRDIAAGVCWLSIAAFFVAVIAGGFNAYRDSKEILVNESQERIAIMTQIRTQSEQLNTVATEVGYYLAAAYFRKERIMLPAEADEIMVGSVNKLEATGFDRLATILRAMHNRLNQ